MPIPDPPTYEHGSTGTEPSSPIDYNNGDPLDEAELDYYLNVEFTKIPQIITALEEIRDGDITVQNATNASSAIDATNVTSTYKGNDIDPDGDGSVAEADFATEASKFESRTDYPANPVDGQVVFRSDKT